MVSSSGHPPESAFGGSVTGLLLRSRHRDWNAAAVVAAKCRRPTPPRRRATATAPTAPCHAMVSVPAAPISGDSPAASLSIATRSAQRAELRRLTADRGLARTAV